MKVSLDRCRKYLDSGLSLITIGDKKIPNIKWKEQQTVQLTKDKFSEYYNLNTTNGVGICTGFNGLEVIDIDLKILPTLKEQQDFWKEYTDFLKDNIDDFENKFTIYKTVNNGYHILYRCAEIGGNQKIAKLQGYQEAIIETRGNGGYVFIYDKQVSKTDYTSINEISIKDREVLFQISKYYNYVEEVLEEQTKLPKQTTSDIKTEISTWNDYNSKTSIFDIIGDEFTIVRKLSNKIIIKRNGAKSAHSGYVFNNTGCMYLFSTGTIYPNEKLISPFAAYTHRYHKGDFKEGAKDLYKKGYGSRIIKEVKSLSKEIKINSENLVFPIDIFPLKIQNYILDCHKTLDSSVDYMGCAMLWLISVIIGNSFKIKVKNGWIESGNIWIAIVGKAGLGKTPSVKNIIFPINKLNNNQIKNYQKQQTKYEAYKDLDKVEKKNSEEIKKPFKTQFIVNDITLEALVDLHEDNRNGIGVFKDELAGWFNDMNKYRQGSDLQFWLSSWSNEGVSLNRKTAKSSFVESPIIPVLGGIQPSILSNYFTSENKDNGFIDRMLCSFPDLEIETYNESEMKDEVLTWYNDYIVTFFERIKKDVIKYDNDFEVIPIILSLDIQAKKEWKRIFNDITNVQNSTEENEYMKSMLPKQKSYIPRFAMLLHVLNCYDKDEVNANISKQTILDSEKLSKYFINMAKKIKVDSINTFDLKTILKTTRELSIKEKIKQIFKQNPDANKTEVAELLSISRKTIYKYLSEENE